MVSSIGSYNAYNNIMSSQNTQKTEEKSGKHFVMFMPDEDTLYSGGNGTGLSFRIKEAENSTEENPIMTAKGIDENGNEFEQTIEINKVNPENATLVEMRALEAYLGADKGDAGFSSLPLGFTGEMGLNNRTDFLAMFDKTVKDQTTLGQNKKANFYSDNLNTYSNFANTNNSNSLLDNLFSNIGRQAANMASKYVNNLIAQYQ